jgi:lipopolysaccharide export system protein LptC
MFANLIKRLAPPLAFGLVAAFTWWLQNLVEPEKPKVEKALRHDPDYFMENFTVTSMNEAGRPHYFMEAQYMAHFPDDDTTRFVKPHLTIYQEDVAPWTVDSEHALATAGGKEVHLMGNVIMQRPDTPEQAGLKLTTKDLLVRPDDEYAETNQPVTIVDASGIVNAVGMQVYMRDEKVLLQSQVRGVYEVK